MIGLLLMAFGFVVLTAEGWLTTIGLAPIGVALMALTVPTLLIVISEVHEDYRR